MLIHHFHIGHNAPCLPPPPPKILHNHCFWFLLGITVVPREIKDNGYAKFGAVNKVHCGLCENREFRKMTRASGSGSGILIPHSRSFSRKSTWSRTSLIRFLFKYHIPRQDFGESLFPSSGQIPNPVKKFPNPEAPTVFRSNLWSREYSFRPCSLYPRRIWGNLKLVFKFCIMKSVKVKTILFQLCIQINWFWCCKGAWRFWRIYVHLWDRGVSGESTLRNGPDKNDSNNGNEHVGMQKRC